MEEPQVAPYGSWKSPITTELITSEFLGLGQVQIDGGDIYYLESRPLEGGRQVVVRVGLQGRTTDITPASFNVRTRVHEYGGGEFVVSNGTVYFSNFSDQRLYRQRPGADPEPLTPAADLRYADGVVDPRRGRMFCVREDHTGEGEAVNTLVSLDLEAGGPGHILTSGNNFYSSPRLSPAGTRLAWLTWNHPNMPWDGTELWVGELAEDGVLSDCSRVAGAEDESIFQPEWSPDGTLYFISDRSGWWNLYRQRDGSIEPVCPLEAEFGEPQWVFGMSTYAFTPGGDLICTYRQAGKYHLARLDVLELELKNIETPYTDISDVHAGMDASGSFVVFTGGSPTEPLSLLRLDLDTGKLHVLRRSREIRLDGGYFSIPQTIEFPTEDGLAAYGYFYPPQNRDYSGPPGEKPPLLVMSHGGPTGSTSTMLRYGLQFWTSRGIAVLDVDYGGSTGYGREYRRRLNGQWGIVDVDDCVNGARYLAARGLVDGSRLAITGGSAGGYTTLCALTFRDVFKAGASHYGIGDLETFVGDTHKFESRYLESLVGPYPERKDLYRQRSPIRFTEQLDCALILLQGLEDKIVPPNQAEMMYLAVRAKELPVAYLTFEGEQHGFRKAENMRRALEAELYFYAKIFGFELADPVEPVHIENL